MTRSLLASILAAAMMMLIPAPASGDPPWKLLAPPPPLPPPRLAHAMAYDTFRHRVVLFGGVDASSSLSDTWEWDGITWTLKATTGPSLRNTFAMAYDAALRRVVLFGGINVSTNLDDTWAWDGITWVGPLPITGTSPSPRNGHAMAYDGCGRVLLFGGNDGSVLLNDTWELIGNTWTQLTPPLPLPLPRWAPAMAYDTARERVVLFGGNASIATSLLSDTWEWDGSAWTQRFPATFPSQRWIHAMAYDAGRDRVVLFGGNGFTAFLGDTWEWDGTSWAPRATTGPSPRQAHAMAYDNARGRVVLFGGGSTILGVLGDTWELPSCIVPCDGDANGDGVRNFADITAVFANWLQPCP